MDKETVYAVIKSIQRRINESHALEESELQGDALHLQLRREQEYGKRTALLRLWEDLNDELPDTH